MANNDKKGWEQPAMIETVILDRVEVQQNGIIRNEKGYLIGRLVSGIEYEGEHVKGLNSLKEPTEADLQSPLFEAIWQAIKGWDIEREYGLGRAGATGTDVKTILTAIEPIVSGVVASAYERGRRETDKSQWLGEAIISYLSLENILGANKHSTSRSFKKGELIARQETIKKVEEFLSTLNDMK